MVENCVHVYVNGKKRPVETISVLERGENKGE
jgi:hypothetical protein